ncbi:hypothetical protein AB0D08_28420 [Kitasatospora sp. NPDC048540]|uniref:hypothetical protein n=1 Tax=unclassified Kitasatospora TaxID=2633591 RepID=UPI00053A3A2C|nr:hypothetical protein [Kitasatospora sp. MBT63]
MSESVGPRAAGRSAAVLLALCGALGAVPAAPVAAGADLLVVRLDPDPAPPGGSTTLHGFVANGGPDRTASAFTVLAELPAGFAFEGPYFPDSCTTGPGAHLLRCTFPAGLPAGRSATVLAPVRVAREVPPGTRAEGHLLVIGTDDRDAADDGTPFTLSVSP